MNQIIVMLTFFQILTPTIDLRALKLYEITLGTLKEFHATSTPDPAMKYFIFGEKMFVYASILMTDAADE